MSDLLYLQLTRHLHWALFFCTAGPTGTDPYCGDERLKLLPKLYTFLLASPTTYLPPKLLSPLYTPLNRLLYLARRYIGHTVLSTYPGECIRPILMVRSEKEPCARSRENALGSRAGL